MKQETTGYEADPQFIREREAWFRAGAGAWWLDSDNADKRAYPRKACTDDTTVIVGMVVYRQSERI